MEKYKRKHDLVRQAEFTSKYDVDKQELEAKYGLPTDVKFCKKCVISNQRPNSIVEFKHKKTSKKQTINFNNDGLWIKETIDGKQRFISSTKLENNLLKNVTIIHLNENSSLVEKINAVSADIRNKEWTLYDVKIFFRRQLV